MTPRPYDGEGQGFCDDSTKVLVVKSVILFDIKYLRDSPPERRKIIFLFLVTFELFGR